MFQGALLCVTEERKKDKGLSKLMGGQSGSTDHGAAGPSDAPKPALKLKGRIWLRHISGIQESSVGSNLSLSIQLDDPSLDHFVLCFTTRPMLNLWRTKLMEHVDYSKNKTRAPRSEASVASSTRQGLKELPSFTATQDTTGSAYDTRTYGDSRNSGNGSVLSGKSGSTAQAPVQPNTWSMSNYESSSSGRNLVDQLRRASRMDSVGSSGIPNEQQWSASGGLDPGLPPPQMLSHTPLDLVLMVSVPVVVQQTQAGVSSSAALKLRLIRSTLEFVASHMGPRDRIAIVAYSPGHEGDVRRTALLNVNRDRSRQRLTDFIEGIGKPWDGVSEDPFRVDSNQLGGASDRTDTITALNVGLDVVLARKSKNPCTGMILINDTSDGPVRGQMDLVMARAEAANVPIHCFGFGKSSNPSSLWLISNHTRGSYTFVKEWYQLRECIAGCVGSLMSTALDQVKIYVSVPGDNHFKVKRVSGPTGAIISSTGKEVDLELGELRFGEVRELFVELEVDFNALAPILSQNGGNRRASVQRRPNNRPAIEQGSATDDFMQRLGLESLDLNDGDGDAAGNGGTDLFDGGAASLIDEVAVLQVDTGYRQVTTGSAFAHLSDPTVLTLEVDASTYEADQSPASRLLADPVVTRRRIEVLVSEMITRSLLLVSRKNYSQALRIVNETHKIVEAVLRTLASDDVVAGGETNDSRSSVNGHRHHSSMMGGSTTGTPARSAVTRQRMVLQRRAIVSLLAILDDLELMATGLESGQRPQFERDGRNAAAQQAMVLRDQQAWSTRTATEALRFLSDNGPVFAAHAFAASRA